MIGDTKRKRMSCFDDFHDSTFTRKIQTREFDGRRQEGHARGWVRWCTVFCQELLGRREDSMQNFLHSRGAQFHNTARYNM